MDALDADLMALLDDSFERLCAQPVGAFIDPEAALAALDHLGDPERVAHWNARLWVPLRDRLIDRAAKSDVRLRDWLPEEAAARILERAGRPRPLPPKMVDELVASDRVRDGVKATLTEALTSFVQKAGSGEAPPRRWAEACSEGRCPSARRPRARCWAASARRSSGS